eukprot:9472711-Pyramimonas_sp.AAC.1
MVGHSLVGARCAWRTCEHLSRGGAYGRHTGGTQEVLQAKALPSLAQSKQTDSDSVTMFTVS